MTRRRPYSLRRSDIRQETDRPTRSIILLYSGRDLDFEDYLYGYPEGTFYAVQLADVPWPEVLEDLSEELGIALDPLPEAPRLRTAVAEALVAGALVDAPVHMEELGVDQDVEWPSYELHSLERKHRIAEARVVELTRLVVADLKLRAAGIAKPSFAVPRIEQFMAPPPPLFAARAVEVPPLPPLPAAPEMGDEVEGEVVEIQNEDEGALEPASKTVLRAREAVAAARDAELPQRLPGGVRRRLTKMPPGSYIAYGEVLDGRVDLCAAMTDGRALGRADRETVVIDYDGEWPVVARRYGQAGRTIYKVEDALRRHGIDIPKDMAS